MTDLQADERLECGNVRFTEDLVAEVDQGRPVIRVPRGDVQRIALRHGILAARPIVQAVLGIGLLLPGCYVLLTMVLIAQEAEVSVGGGVEGPGKAAMYVLVGLVLGGLIGAWLLLEAFKRGFYLEVVGRKSTEKLRFDGRLPQAEIDEFLASVRFKLGWVIDQSSYE